jgi:cytochrome c oxidase cbb3-type subunit 3
MTAKTCGALLLCIAATGCGGTPPHGGATAAPPPIVTAVGPIPGPPSASNPPANPYANDRTAMGEGRQLFVRFNCSGCHGGRAGGGMGPSLRDVDWIYGNNDAQVFSSITEGRAHGMPSSHAGSDVETGDLHQVASDAQRAASATH